MGNMKKLRSENQERVYKGSTVGMIMNHPNLTESKLIRCQYYKSELGIELHAVSGHNLSRIKQIPTVTISIQEYNNRDWDPSCDTREFLWAMNLLGCE
jgi:hypothetical protein